MSRTIGPSTNIYSTNEFGLVSKITDDSNWRDMRADISPNGNIVFMSNRKADVKIDLHKTSETFNIFTVDTKKKQVIQMTQGANNKESPRWDPDGKWMAYIQKKQDLRELNIVDQSGKTHTALLSAPNILDYAWSPDGKKIVYVILKKSDSILGTLDVDTGNTTALLSYSLSDNSTGREQIASAQWSPDGKKIAFITSALDKNSRYLKVFDVESRITTALSPDNMHVQSPVDWSRDSDRILYSALKDYRYYYDEKVHRKMYEGSMQVFLTDLTGSQKQLTNGDFLHKRPVFSPDEKKIAYFFAPDLGARTLALITMKPDGSDKRQLYDKISSDSILEWH